VNIARRYAQALYHVALSKGTVEAATRDLAAVVSLFDANANLEAVLSSPMVAPTKKRAVVEALVTAAPDTNPEVARLLTLLADRGRFSLLRALAAEFTRLTLESNRVMSGEIVTAVPVDAARKTRLAEALSHATDRRVVLADRVDPSIIAGVVAKIGGVVYDGSAARQVDVMRQKLASDA
jgi:F-type H+-transporting ATPase subunit delta